MGLPAAMAGSLPHSLTVIFSFVIIHLVAFCLMRRGQSASLGRFGRTNFPSNY
jgi:hypothetical protein